MICSALAMGCCIREIKGCELRYLKNIIVEYIGFWCIVDIVFVAKTDFCI